MHRGLHLGAFVAFALVASPVAAQQAAYPLPSADQTAHSVPPPPPPERRAESPPPFPPMSRTAPHHARARAVHETARTSHHRAERREASSRATGHSARTATHALTRQEKKNQRFCATLSHRKALRNSTCRKLEKQKRQSAPPHQLTKQEKKDERRCSSLSLRQVMRDSKCRKVAERQLQTSRDRGSAKPSKHRHGASLKAARRHESNAAHGRAAKHRRR